MIMYLFYVHSGCFILLFKKVLGQVSAASAAINLSRTIGHSWLPGLTDGSCFSKQSFPLLPSLSAPHCHIFMAFHRDGSDLQGLGGVTFGILLQE